MRGQIQLSWVQKMGGRELGEKARQETPTNGVGELDQGTEEAKVTRKFLGEKARPAVAPHPPSGRGSLAGRPTFTRFHARVTPLSRAARRARARAVTRSPALAGWSVPLALPPTR